MSYYGELNQDDRSWYRLQELNTEYIEQKLRGNLTPSLESIIHNLNQRRRREGNYGIWTQRNEVRREPGAVSGQD